MRILRALFLFAIFCIDVQVKAEGPAKGCWGNTLPCAVKTDDTARLLEAKGLRLTVGKDSLVEQRETSALQLVRGDFYVETENDVKFHTPYADFWCEQECKALITRRTEDVTIKSLEGQWTIRRLGEKQTYGLKAGLQVSISEVAADGMAAMDFPQSLPWLPTVKEWAALYPGKLEKLKPELEKFRFDWKEGVEAMSVLHRQTAARSIASYEKAQAEERARQRAREREDESLRKLFRQKNDLDP